MVIAVLPGAMAFCTLGLCLIAASVQTEINKVCAFPSKSVGDVSPFDSGMSRVLLQMLKDEIWSRYESIPHLGHV